MLLIMPAARKIEGRPKRRAVAGTLLLGAALLAGAAAVRRPAADLAPVAVPAAPAPRAAADGDARLRAQVEASRRRGEMVEAVLQAMGEPRLWTKELDREQEAWNLTGAMLMRSDD